MKRRSRAKGERPIQEFLIYPIGHIFVVRAKLVAKFQAKDLSPKGTSGKYRLASFCAYHRPLYACSGPSWIDNSISGFPKTVRLLNDGDKHELHIAR